MILIDGVTLAEYKVAHPYKLVGNMRQRINTISISFEEPILNTVTTIEILEGCQMPTLARACMGSRNTSCIEITEGVKYERKDGVWVTYFEGYTQDKEYCGDENSFLLYTQNTYKGHKTTPLIAFTDFFDGRDISGEYYYGNVIASTGNTQKGYLTVLKFVNPINSKEFNRLNLRVYTNHVRTIFAYNGNDITEDSLGIAVDSFNLRGAAYTTLSIDTAFYADEDGMLRTIVFRFNEDGEPFINSEGKEVYDANGDLERDQLFFVSYNVQNHLETAFLTEDSLIIVDGDESYDVIFRFNKSGEFTSDKLDLSKVTLNGQTLAKVLAECKTATAKWTSVGSFYQISVTLPKSYTGVSQIKNPENAYTSNSMGVLKGLKFPDGSELEKNYTCHIYATEKILDSETVDSYDDITVLDVTHRYDEHGNLRFVIHFDKMVATANYFHACEVESWRSTELFASSSLYYDKGMSNVFVKNGYKSSLLDCIVINGKSIGEWHSFDADLTNIQTHYGSSGLDRVDVIFASHAKKTFNEITNASDYTVEIKEGLKFMTNCQVKKTQVFLTKNGVFSEVVTGKKLHVYYDGSEITNGANLTVKTAVCPSSVMVTGVEDYQINHTTNDKVTQFVITYNNGETFTFTVNEDSVASESQQDASSETAKSGGCGSSVELPMIAITLCAIALAVLLKEKRKYE